MRAARARRSRFLCVDAAGFRLSLEIAPDDTRTDLDIIIDLRDSLNQQIISASLSALKSSLTTWPADIAAESNKEDVQF